MDLPNVTLVTGRKVTRLETDPSGRTVTEVVCQTEQGEERWTGDIVVLAAGAANTAAVLLASANAAHPSGSARPRGQGVEHVCAPGEPWPGRFGCAALAEPAAPRPIGRAGRQHHDVAGPALLALLGLADHPVTVLPLGSVSSRVTLRPVTSVTFGRSIRGSMAIERASDLAFSRHG